MEEHIAGMVNLMKTKAKTAKIIKTFPPFLKFATIK